MIASKCLTPVAFAILTKKMNNLDLGVFVRVPTSLSFEQYLAAIWVQQRREEGKTIYITENFQFKLILKYDASGCLYKQ